MSIPNNKIICQDYVINDDDIMNPYDLDNFPDCKWWITKISEFEDLDKENRIKFIEDNYKYYMYCQQKLYKWQDPYYLPEKTLTEFIFCNYIGSNFQVAQMIFDNYVLAKLDLQKYLSKICKAGYFPAIKWLQSVNLLSKFNCETCFIDASSYGYIDIVKLLFIYISNKNILTKSFDLSIKYNKIDVTKWIYAQGFRVTKHFIDITINKIIQYKNVLEYSNMLQFLKSFEYEEENNNNQSQPLISQSFFKC
jgi:hypothetical protein